VVAAASGSSSIWRIEAVTPSAIHLVQGFNVAGEIAYGVEYVLDLNWSVAGVRSISGFETHHKKLVLSGALSSVLGPEYFAALAREVRYWDGETWVMHSAMVRQLAVRANQRPSPAGSVSNHGHGSDAEGPSRIPEMSEGRNRRLH
jgi:hypothetical protein